jgi:hypothetical protein
MGRCCCARSVPTHASTTQSSARSHTGRETQPTSAPEPPQSSWLSLTPITPFVRGPRVRESASSEDASSLCGLATRPRWSNAPGVMKSDTTTPPQSANGRPRDATVAGVATTPAITTSSAKSSTRWSEPATASQSASYARGAVTTPERRGVL